MLFSVPRYVHEELGFNKWVWTRREFDECCRHYQIKVFVFTKAGGEFELSPYNFNGENLQEQELSSLLAYLLSATPFHGAYVTISGNSGVRHRVIILDGDLSGTKFLIAGLHELGHFFDSPNVSDFHMIRFTQGFLCNLKPRAEYRAHVFPVCALLPRTILESKTAREIQKEFGYLMKWINFRLRVAKKHDL